MNVSPNLNSSVPKLTLVAFDATDPQHVDAFASIVYNNRQHPTLRFEVKYPYVDMRVMMLDKIARAYTDQMLGSNSRTSV